MAAPWPILVDKQGEPNYDGFAHVSWLRPSGLSPGCLKSETSAIGGFGMPMSFDDFRDQFPLVSEYTFLNHAATSPLPTCVVQAMENHLFRRQYLPKYRDELKSSVEEARATMAALINVSPDEIAFVENTATGISIAANGLPLEPGDEIILTDMEYPANVYPWVNLGRKGIKVHIIPNHMGGLDMDVLKAVVNERTKVVTVSSVEFLSGYRTDLAAMGAFCRQRGICFVVDAIQSLGVIPMDVRASQIDFMATGGPKWLLGPRGQGFLFCRREVVDEISPVLTGAGGVVGKDDYLNYDMTFLSDASRFHIGALNETSIAGLKAAAEMLMAVGIAKIESRVLELTDVLIKELQDRGYPIFSNLEPRHRSAIVTFETPDADATCAKLTAHNVIVCRRCDARGKKFVRVSPHGYNNEEDIARFLEVLDK